MVAQPHLPQRQQRLRHASRLTLLLVLWRATGTTARCPATACADVSTTTTTVAAATTTTTRVGGGVTSADEFLFIIIAISCSCSCSPDEHTGHAAVAIADFARLGLDRVVRLKATSHATAAAANTSYTATSTFDNATCSRPFPSSLLMFVFEEEVVRARQKELLRPPSGLESSFHTVY